MASDTLEVIPRQWKVIQTVREKFTCRQCEKISLSTLADLIGHAVVALAPIHALIENHVLSADRLHGDDTTVPLRARGGTKTARLWT